MTDTPAATAATDLAILADETWLGQMEAHPLYATAIGDHRFLEALPPNDDGAADRDAGRLRELVARARALPADALEPADIVTRDALLDMLAFELGIVESGLARWSVDPLDGPQVEFLNVPSYQPSATEAEGDAQLARWREMGPWIDRHVAGLRAAIADGLVAPRALVDSVVDELDDLLAAPDESWTLFAPATAAHADWRPGRPRPLRRRHRGSGPGRDPAAYQRQRAFLADELRPIARPDEQAGLSHVPGRRGRVPPARRGPHDARPRPGGDPQDRARGDRPDRRRVRGAGRQPAGHGERRETLDRLRHDPALRFATRDEVRETAAASLGRANDAIGAWFGRLPVTPCEVVVMGDHESKHSTIAYYRQPAADGSRPGRYYINTTLPETRPRYEAEALAFHEAVPGHHLQLAIAQELSHLPAFRRFDGPTAFIEGWALYTERLSEEMGLYSGPMDRFGILSFDAWRACRLVVDTGMHALGWTRRQAIDFMLAHTALAENNIVNEVDRYLAIPGQALAYKLGQLEFLRLRREAESGAGRRVRHPGVPRRGARRGQRRAADRAGRGRSLDRAGVGLGGSGRRGAATVSGRTSGRSSGGARRGSA
jgi:uncharacterized protein (DUF885 family)